MNKKYISTILAAMIATTSLYSATKHNYFGAAVGKVTMDDIPGDGDTIYGLDSRTLYEGTTTPWLFGFESLIAGNSDTVSINLGLNAGYEIKFDNGKRGIKPYAILGYGVQLLDIETQYDSNYMGLGTYYGFGVTYDINDDFAVHLTYRKHKNELSSDEDGDPYDGIKYDMSETNFAFSIKF